MSIPSGSVVRRNAAGWTSMKLSLLVRAVCALCSYSQWDQAIRDSPAAYRERMEIDQVFSKRIYSLAADAQPGLNPFAYKKGRYMGLLTGKVALVTGASSGIGAATALALAGAGASVAISARRADRLADLVAQIEAVGGKALALPGDMTVEADAIKAVEDTVAQLGRIDILINSADVMQAGGIADCDTG